MINKLKLIIWIIIPFLLLILPSTFFDNGQSICPSKLLLDKDCPGCGITRSIQHAVHFEWKIAWEYNKLIIVVLPFLVYFWIKTFLELFSKIKKSH